jgi:N-acetylglucosamine malate deacetylase 1
MKKILIISPHPDDETLGCGGTILKYKSKKAKIDWLIATTMNGNNQYSIKDIKIREKQILKVKKMYGFNKVYELNLPTTKLDQIPTSKIVKKFSEVIKKSKPKVIFSNFYGDVHTDHKIISKVVSSCTKNFRAPFIEKIMLYETLSETGYSHNRKKDNFVPNSYVNISKFMKKKIKIMKIYKSEIMKGYKPRSIFALDALAKFRGVSINCKHAEAFMLIYEKQ